MLSDSFHQDLYDHLFFWLGELRRGPRRWVMSHEWENDCRRLGIELGYSPPASLHGTGELFGLPVEVRDDGGVPHLEAS